MTAINVIRQSRAVHVIADGASFSPTGERLFPSAKLWPLPHLSAVVAMRGAKLLSPLLADLLGSVALSFDQLKLVAVDALRAYLPQYAGMFGGRADALVFDLVVAGVSMDRGPESFLICSHDLHSLAAPWSIVDLPDVFMLPSDERKEHDLAASIPPGASVDDLNPVALGVRMLELQRAGSFPLVPGGDVHARVGGFGQLMSVTADMIATRIIHRWPEA